MSVIKSGLKVIAVVLMTSPLAAIAQNMQQTQTPQQRAQRQTEMMQKQFNLSADQTTSVNAINMRTASSMDSLMHSGGDKTSMGPARKQIMDSRDAQMQQVLTPDQYKQYQAAGQQRMQKMQQRRQSMQQGQPDMNNTGNN